MVSSPPLKGCERPAAAGSPQDPDKTRVDRRTDCSSSRSQCNGMEKNDLPSPQREAAFFFGLFLRGHDLDELRQDIDVPQAVLAKWVRQQAHETEDFRETARRIYEFRKQVLAIFNFLVSSEATNVHKM